VYAGIGRGGLSRIAVATMGKGTTNWACHNIDIRAPKQARSALLFHIFSPLKVVSALMRRA
jgi:hypothetical protein